MRRRFALAVSLSIAGFIACSDAITNTETDDTDANIPVSMIVISGSNQFAPVGTELPDPLVVRVVNATGTGVAGQLVNWRVVAGGGDVYAGVGKTDANGYARERWTLGPTPGPQSVEARAVHPTTGAKLSYGTFVATAVEPGSTSCSGVDRISVGPHDPTLQVGQRGQFTAFLYDAQGIEIPANGHSLVWSSSNTAVGTIAQDGWATAVAIGSTTVSVSCGSLRSATSLTVTAAPTPIATVAVDPANVTLAIGGTQQVRAIARDALGNVLTGRVVTWASDNTAVATVNSTGMVTAVAAGTATITATSEGRSGSAVVNVTGTAPPPPGPAPIATVTVSPASASLMVGATQQVSAIARDSAGNVLTGRLVSWSSNNNAVATVSSLGLVTAVGVGTATITATSEGQSGTSTITVTSPPPPSGDVTWWDDFRAGNFISRGMQLYGDWGAIINVAPATGLGFPTGILNVAQNIYRPTFGFIYSTDNLWPAPPVGGHVFFRMLLRQSLPAQTGAGTGGDHGFQESVGEAEIEWFWRVWHGDSDSFYLEASTWQNSIGGNPELQIDAPKNTVLRLEWRLTKTGASTGTATFRVYNNQTGALLGESPAFPMTGMTDAKYRRARWGMSGQGGADFSGGSVYWGGIAVRVSTDANAWIGAYPTLSER